MCAPRELAALGVFHWYGTVAVSVAGSGASRDPGAHTVQVAHSRSDVNLQRAKQPNPRGPPAAQTT